MLKTASQLVTVTKKRVILRKGVIKRDINYIFNFKDGKHDFLFQIDLALCLMQMCAKTFEKYCILMFLSLIWRFRVILRPSQNMSFGIELKFTKI